MKYSFYFKLCFEKYLVKLNINLKETTPNAYEALYVKDLMNYMESSRMIGIYHFNNIITRGRQNGYRHFFKRNFYGPIFHYLSPKDNPACA